MTCSSVANVGTASKIEVLRSEAIEPTARLLAAAFADNPCYAFMHPRAAVRQADITAFFERNLRWREPLQLSFVARDTRGDVIGTGTLAPPGGGVPKTLGKVVSHWIWPTLRGQGLRTLVRTIATERAFVPHERFVAGRPDYWYVHAVAVRPDLQGRAVGSAIMRRLLSELEARDPKAALPVVLATQREANLKFYARFGFRLKHQATIGRAPRNASFHSWFMRLEPNAPRAA